MIQVQAIVDHHHNVDAKVPTKVRFQEPGNQSNNVTDDTKLMQETELNNKELDAAEEANEKEEATENKEENEEETKLIGGSPKTENRENAEKEKEAEAKEAKENEALENKSPEIKKPTITP